MRDIEDILHFRSDIPPFLVHLTRDYRGVNPKDNLASIIDQKELVPGDTEVSVAKFGGYTHDMPDEERLAFFGAVCFTETPLNEVHSLLDIRARQTDLQPYGLVFLKEPLQKRGVSPVLYLNNETRNQSSVVEALFSLTTSAPGAAKMILPLISAFGEKIQPAAARQRQQGRMDFIWEREWRLPYARGPFSFSESDVFVGLCPEEEIGEFEALFPGVSFVDPRRNMKWYATKLIEARHRLDIKHSVV